MFEDRHLSFNKFLQERAEQISKFRDILKLDTKKKGHQALPKCVRRRAMSHNRYRIPSKLRKIFEEQLIKSQNMLRLPKCRKHIRKSPRLILSYKERHSKTKWLSTHLWSARRMRMIDYHGYKVAETPNQKCYRSSYRHFMHNCCMFDMSYYQCLTFWFENQNDQLPRSVSVACDKNSQHQSSLRISDLKTNRSYDGCLYSKENLLICPVILFRSGKSNDNQARFALRCFFNPCALEEVKELISGKTSNQVELDRCKSQLYCLVGPEWQNKLFEALKIYGLTLNIQTLDLLKYNPGLAEYFIPDQEIKSQIVPHISSQISSLTKENYSVSQESASIRQQTLKLFQMLTKNKNQTQQEQKPNKESQKFWKFYQSILSPSQKVNITITTRSKYTHKRKNKMSKESKKKVAALQTKKKELLSSKQAIEQEDPDSASYDMISQSLQNIKNEIKEFFIDERDSRGLNLQDENKKLKDKTNKVNPVLVTSFKKQQLFQGCYVLCSDDDSCRLWRILSKLNIKVIGLQQLRHITLESQHLSFPQDYPETKSFISYAQKEAVKEMTRMRRLPPSKRINFLKINSPNPFSLVQKSLIKKCHKVFVEMVNRGRCFTNSYIYELTQQDVAVIEKELNQNGKIGIVLTQTTLNKHTNGSKLNSKAFLDYSKETLESVELKLSQLKQQRQLIGRVLTGGYLYTKNRQGGVGYISQSVGKNVDELLNDGYVLIRKVTSPHYYLAQITKFYPNLDKK